MKVNLREAVALCAARPDDVVQGWFDDMVADLFTRRSVRRWLAKVAAGDVEILWTEDRRRLSSQFMGSVSGTGRQVGPVLAELAEMVGQ